MEYHSSQTKILLRFASYYASNFQQWNYCSSSLLSLSRIASWCRIYLLAEWYRSELQRRKAHPNTSLVYLNLRESLLVRSKTTMNFLSPRSQQVARQGPAVTVTPVFTPTKPFLLSNLLVFSHITSFLAPSLVIQVRQDGVETICEKRGMCRQRAMRRARSQGLEALRQLGSPCGFPKVDCRIYSSFALRFILCMKALRGVISSGLELISAPPQLARASAASLPLGSISPYSNCSMLITSPAISSALVPVISPASSSITAKQFPISTYRSTAIWYAVQKVIILVRLAISAEFLNRFPVITCRVGYSITTKLSALIWLSYFLSRQMTGF